MSGRTCQLCGKALSRFTVGSGGDFCSREHRNQFRLRTGMDRLHEANKVASLMRRRENAKTIPAGQLARDSKVLPRVSPHLRIPVRRPAVDSLRPLAAALEITRIASISRPLPPPRKAVAPARPVARTLDSAESFASRPMRPLLPPLTDGLPAARMAPAPAVVPRVSVARVPDRRQVAELGLNLRRTHIGGNGIQVPSLRSPTQNCQDPQPPRRLNNSADRGRELRVSGGIGFRLPKARIRTIEFAGPRTAPLRRFTELRSMSAASQPNKGIPATAAGIRIVVRGLFGPTPPKQNSATVFRWPEALANGRVHPHRADGAARSCDIEWKAPDPCPPQLRHQNGVVRLHPAAPQVPSISAGQPRDIQSALRLTLVTFEPQETPFECSPTALHGTLMGGMHCGAAPLRKVESPPATLEEHFEAGLNKWQGGTGDWKVDVAGVRAGSLALYSPSLEVGDYALEFLARIESRAVTWVFRAANLTDYYRATLAVAPGGGYEFRRCAVIGGQAEAATVRPIPVAMPAPTGKTAVTLRTCVAGNEFTVSLDGQVIETWTDSRLTTGGIGFVGAPEDRARLYWVKVTPTGNLSKEYSKR